MIERYSRKEMDDIRSLVISYGAKGLAWAKLNNEGILEGGISKFITDDILANLTVSEDSDYYFLLEWILGL